jgi:hypothetical protein
LNTIRWEGDASMLRVTAAVAVVFAFGAGAMTVLGGWLGGSAEAASLGLVGAGLVGASYFLGGRIGTERAPQPSRRPIQQTRTA